MPKQILKKITSYIKQRRLTDCLELLEKFNISNKKALVCIARIQRGQRQGGAL